MFENPIIEKEETQTIAELKGELEQLWQDLHVYGNIDGYERELALQANTLIHDPEATIEKLQNLLAEMHTAYNRKNER